MRRCSGLGLIECMIAMALSSFLILGLTTFFLSNQAQYRYHNTLAEMQEQARIAFIQVSYDLRMAGFGGCQNFSQRPVKMLAKDQVAETLLPYVMVLDKEKYEQLQRGAHHLPRIQDRVVAGSSILLINKMADSAQPIAREMGRFDEALVVGKTNTWHQGDLALVSDCESADLFKVTHIHNNRLYHSGTTNYQEALSKKYGSDALVAPWETVIYFLRRESHSEEGALYRYSSLTRQSESQISHVTQFHTIPTHYTPIEIITLTRLGKRLVHKLLVPKMVQVKFDMLPQVQLGKAKRVQHYSFNTYLRNVLV